MGSLNQDAQSARDRRDDGDCVLPARLRNPVAVGQQHVSAGGTTHDRKRGIQQRHHGGFLSSAATCSARGPGISALGANARNHSKDGKVLVSEARWAGGLPYRIGSWLLVRSKTESSLVLSKIISSRVRPVRSYSPVGSMASTGQASYTSRNRCSAARR